MPQSGRFPAADSGEFSQAISARTRVPASKRRFLQSLLAASAAAAGTALERSAERQAIGNSATSLASEALIYQLGQIAQRNFQWLNGAEQI